MAIDFEAEVQYFIGKLSHDPNTPITKNVYPNTWRVYEERLRSIAQRARADALEEIEDEILADPEVDPVFIIRALKGQL